MLRGSASGRAVGRVFRAAAARHSSQLASAPAPEMAAFAMPPPKPASQGVRNDWSREEVAAIYSMPFTELLFRAASVHRAHWDPLEVQRCTLLSIKTGGCTARQHLQNRPCSRRPTRPPAAPEAYPLVQGSSLRQQGAPLPPGR